MEYHYVNEVNPNLICSICQSPFQDPITVKCNHTFCLHCLQQLLSTTQNCPLDRKRIEPEWTQSKIVSNLVDELPVYCVQKSLCKWQGQRQFLRQHLQSCEYYPKPCKWNGCNFSSSKIWEHEGNCEYKVVKCNECDVELLNGQLEAHKADCKKTVVECSHCMEKIPVSRLDNHLSQCGMVPVKCTHTSNGCSWTGIRSELQEHLKSCSYEAIKGFLNIYEERYLLLEQENLQLKARLTELETTIFNLSRNMLDLMSQGSFSDEMGIRIHPTIIENIGRDMQLVKADVEQIGLQVLQNDKKVHDQISTQINPLREEIQSLRSICQSVQLQLFNLALRNAPRNQTISNTPLKSPVDQSNKAKGNTKL